MTHAMIEAQADGAIECDPFGEVALPPEWTVGDVVALLQTLPNHIEGNGYPLRHQFAPGVYLREITMPATHVVVGRVHKTSHFNIISKGCVSFWMPGHAVQTVTAPYTFVSEAGAQKVLYIHEDTVWTTVHPTDETDVETLENILAEPNPLLLDRPTTGELL